MDGLSMFIVKLSMPAITAPLIYIFNLSLTTSCIPSQLKIAKIVPIVKSGHPLFMDNYRPISLLGVFF
jgi:hypothetical protein